MKRYLVTPFSERDLSRIREYYDGWEYSKIRNLEKNAEAYRHFSESSVDTVYVFAKRLDNPEEFGGIASQNVYVTKSGGYFWNSGTESYERFENGSEILIPRIEGLEKEYLAFLKAYLSAAFDIRVLFSYDFRLDFFGTKRFSAYWGKVSGCDSHIPKMVLPLFSRRTDPKLFRNFLQSENGVGKKVIVKIEGYSGGKGVYAFDLDDPKDANNFLVAVSQLQESGKKSIGAFELLDTRDYEIRTLWTKNEKGVKIVEMYKRMRPPRHVVHVPSGTGEIEKLYPSEIPKGLKESIETFCSVIIDNHGGLDTLITKDGKYYFIENNVLTGYLDGSGELPVLKNWLNAISDSYA